MPALLLPRFWNGARHKGINTIADYQVTSLANGCYPGTKILINKLDIRNQGDLDAVESAIVPAKAALWAENPPVDSFDFAHYCTVHKFLFEDLYDWAGVPRTVDISKKGTQFCPATQIESVAQAIFTHLKEQNYLCGILNGKLCSRIQPIQSENAGRKRNTLTVHICCRILPASKQARHLVHQTPTCQRFPRPKIR